MLEKWCLLTITSDRKKVNYPIFPFLSSYIITIAFLALLLSCPSLKFLKNHHENIKPNKKNETKDDEHPGQADEHGVYAPRRYRE